MDLSEIAPELPRHEFVRRIWDAFCQVHGVTREMSNVEFELARKWAMCGAPLATVVQGIRETTGPARRLEACRRAVEQNVERWREATGFRAPAAAPAPKPHEPLPAADREAAEFFDAMKLRLSGVIAWASHATWIRPVAGRAWESGGEVLVVVVPGPQWTEQMRLYADRLRAAAAELGKPGLKFRSIVVQPDDSGG